MARSVSVASATPWQDDRSGSGAPCSVRVPSVRRTVPSSSTRSTTSVGISVVMQRAAVAYAPARASARPGTADTATAPSMERARETQSVDTSSLQSQVSRLAGRDAEATRAGKAVSIPARSDRPAVPRALEVP
eukprot:7382935-Prymnesium_polylepis.2